MPSAPKRPCAHPACRNLVVKGTRYCPFHAPAPEPDNRGSSAERGYGTARWVKYRRWYLAHHPVCVVCGAPATDVDHIRPATGPDDPTFYDESNHQALCHSCHSRKTAKENGGFGNRHGA